MEWNRHAGGKKNVEFSATGHDSRKSLVLGLFRSAVHKKSGKRRNAQWNPGISRRAVCSFAEDLALSAERRGGLGLGGRIVKHMEKGKESKSKALKTRGLRRV